MVPFTLKRLPIMTKIWSEDLLAADGCARERADSRVYRNEWKAR